MIFHIDVFCKQQGNVVYMAAVTWTGTFWNIGFGICSVKGI